MVSTAIETPAEAPVETPVDPAPQEAPQETENPAPAEVAAPEPESATAATSELQVEVSEPEKPNYITREEWETERAEVAKKAAADALEGDRRKRQTENARKAKAEADDREAMEEAVDIVRVATADPNYDPNNPTQQVVKAIERLAKKKADRLTASSADTVDQAFDFITAPVYGQQVDLDESFEPAARKLAPKIQHLIDTIRPQIETEARKGYTADADLPAKVEAEIARRAAQSRVGQEELVRPSGEPTNVNTNSIEYWETRVAHEGEDGYPDMSSADWNTYKALRRQHGYS